MTNEDYDVRKARLEKKRWIEVADRLDAAEDEIKELKNRLRRLLEILSEK